MDTLVDSNRQAVQLVFSRNSTLNTNILINGQIRYIVSTTDRHAKETKIVDGLTKVELVSIRRRTFFPDKIMFANRSSVERKLSDVMKDYKMDDG
jgi:hypothetical protein